MSDAQTILKMIEEVSPDDTAKLDEIDARVWCMVKNYKDLDCNDGVYSCSINGKKNFFFPTKVTRSRDALKDIRRKGVQWHIETVGNKYHALIFNKVTINSPPLPTEELAELHAIIQAIAYERGQS